MANPWEMDWGGGDGRIEVRPSSDGPSSASRAGITAIESGGRYDLVGPATRNGDRAVGKYQVMGRNIPEWTREALGREMSVPEFRSSPEAQDAVFNHRFGMYEKKYGPAGAARAWFAGEGGMNDYGRKDVLGTSVADYERMFNSHVKRSGAGDAMAFAQPQKAEASGAAPWEMDWSSAPAPDNRIEVRPSSATPEKEVGPQMPDNGALAAGGRGVAQGVTFGFNDEMIGLGAVAGPGESLAQGFYKYLKGDPEAVGRYNAAVNAQRAKTKAAEEQHPVASTVGNVAGALAVPVGGAVRGATIGGRALNAARVGAVAGGLAGAGEGEGAVDTAAKAAGGTVLGGILGGLGAPILEGGARAIGAAVGKPLNYLRSAINPQGAAERAVGRASVEAQRVDPQAANRLTAADLGPNNPGTVMDTLGAPGRDLARSAANLSGEARDTLNATIQPRYEGQGGRVTQWLRQTFNYPDAHATEQAIDRVERTTNRAAYARAETSPAAQSLWDENLQRLATAPVVQDAIRGAERTSANKAAAAGQTPQIRNPFRFDANGNMTMIPGATPNLRFWDAVKKNLDDTISTAQRKGDNNAAADAIALKNQLTQHLDQAVPAYGAARRGASAFFNAENALEAGQNFVTGRFDIPQTRQAIARMSPAERTLFQDGFVSRYIETLDKIPDRADVVRRIFKSPDDRARIVLAIGHQRANELEALLRVENIMQQSNRAVTGNSTTTQQLAQMGLAGGGGAVAGAAGGAALGYDPTTAGIVGALTTAGKRGVDIRVARHVAEMLMSNDPAMLRRATQMIANNQRLMGAFRAADTGAARLGGQNAPVGLLPNLQAAGVGRAEDSQPEIPRPPGQ